MSAQVRKNQMVSRTLTIRPEYLAGGVRRHLHPVKKYRRITDFLNGPFPSASFTLLEVEENQLSRFQDVRRDQAASRPGRAPMNVFAPFAGDSRDQRLENRTAAIGLPEPEVAVEGER